MKIADFNHTDWVNQWAGTWSILSFSYWGNFYCRKPFSEDADRYVRQTIIVWHKGKGWAYQRNSEKEIFAKKLEKIIEKDKNFPKKLCKKFKSATDRFLSFVDTHIGKDISFVEYKKFQNLLTDGYYPYHIEVKVVVDYLKQELLKMYLPLFEEARVYAEPVFTRSEEFMRKLAIIHSKKTGYTPRMILALTHDEFDSYFSKRTPLPDKKILEKRFQASAFLFDEKEMRIATSKHVATIEKIINQISDATLIKGNTAYPGKVKGKVCLVFDPSKAKNFQQGNILVTGMTRPEFLPLMKKAGGFVTDGGGILCHAAIVARELKKPCVVGTMNATKVLKNGDMVALDADKGIVKKI